MITRAFSALARAAVALGIAAAVAFPQCGLAVTVSKGVPKGSEATLDDLQRAVADLSDSTQIANWHNIAGYIGVLGFPEGFRPLHDIIWTRFHGAIDGEALSAVNSAQANMGPVAASSPGALKYLIESTRPSFWKTLPWTDPRQPSGALWLHLSELSIYALGVSGNAEAGQMLARLRQSPYREAQRPAIEAAIREHQRVVQVGGAKRYEALKWGSQGHWRRVVIREVPALGDSATANTPLAGLKLGLALDEDVYAVGQPIIVMACLRNEDSGRVEIPFPSALQFDLRLETREGKRVRPIGYLFGDLPSEDSPTLTLRPSAVQCEVIDLLSRYGAWPGKKHPVAAAAKEHVLPPGQYRLMAVYKPEPHRRRDGAVIIVPSDTVGFEIAPLERFPKEVALLRDFARQGRYEGKPAVGDSAISFARPWLGKFASSRFFMLAYKLGGWWDCRDELDSLVGVLQAARVSPVRQAAVIWYGAKFAPRTYKGMLSWLANLKSRRLGEPQEAAAATWEERLRLLQGRLH